MPIYEYECPKCDETKELIASQRSTRCQICKRCGSKMVLKVSAHSKTAKKWEV